MAHTDEIPEPSDKSVNQDYSLSQNYSLSQTVGKNLEVGEDLATCSKTDYETPLTASLAAYSVATLASASASRVSAFDAGLDQVHPEATVSQVPVHATMRLDWVEFTVKTGLQTVLEALPFLRDASVIYRPGRSGYAGQSKHGDVGVFYSTHPKRGCHVVITGDGCRYLEQQGFVPDWVELLRHLRGYEIHMSRIDVAFDDRSGILAMDVLEAWCQARAFATHFQTWAQLDRKATHAAVLASRGLQFGERSSPCCLRIYDKALEQGLGPEQHWIRVEMEMKHQQANLLAKAMIAGGLEAAAGLLRSKLDFKVAGSASRKDR